MKSVDKKQKKSKICQILKYTFIAALIALILAMFIEHAELVHRLDAQQIQLDSHQHQIYDAQKDAVVNHNLINNMQEEQDRMSYNIGNIRVNFKSQQPMREVEVIQQQPALPDISMEDKIGTGEAIVGTVIIAGTMLFQKVKDGVMSLGF